MVDMCLKTIVYTHSPFVFLTRRVINMTCSKHNVLLTLEVFLTQSNKVKITKQKDFIKNVTKYVSRVLFLELNSFNMPFFLLLRIVPFID